MAKKKIKKLSLGQRLTRFVKNLFRPKRAAGGIPKQFRRPVGVRPAQFQKVRTKNGRLVKRGGVRPVKVKTPPTLSGFGRPIRPVKTPNFTGMKNDRLLKIVNKGLDTMETFLDQFKQGARLMYNDRVAISENQAVKDIRRALYKGAGRNTQFLLESLETLKGELARLGLSESLLYGESDDVDALAMAELASDALSRFDQAYQVYSSLPSEIVETELAVVQSIGGSLIYASDPREEARIRATAKILIYGEYNENYTLTDTQILEVGEAVERGAELARFTSARSKGNGDSS